MTQHAITAPPAHVGAATKAGRLPKFLDCVGARSGMLTITGIVSAKKHKEAIVLVRCDCGIEKQSRFRSFRNAKSCGCQRGKAQIKHGWSFSAGKTKEYRTWRGMKYRTQNPSYKSWLLYGGRGIGMHPEWVKSFTSFLTHVGPAPSPQHSIDRINNNGDYEPGNVRWATAAEQAHNMRTTVLTMEKAELARGMKAAGLSVREISSRIGINRDTIRSAVIGKTWKPIAAPSALAALQLEAAR